MTEFLVEALRGEHKDREWVDAYGYHWAWCGDTWMWRCSPEMSAQYPKSPGYEQYHQWRKPEYSEKVNERRRDLDYGPGPFMEAVHHRAVYGRQWERGF
jgi:hypothetical protein